jgi:hypothetical protein
VFRSASRYALIKADHSGPSFSSNLLIQLVGACSPLVSLLDLIIEFHDIAICLGLVLVTAERIDELLRVFIRESALSQRESRNGGDHQAGNDQLRFMKQNSYWIYWRRQQR